MTGVQGQAQAVQVEGKPVEEVSEFCYLGSVIAGDGNCDKDIRIRLGKANSTFWEIAQHLEEQRPSHQDKDPTVQSTGHVNPTVTVQRHGR